MVFVLLYRLLLCLLTHPADCSRPPETTGRRSVRSASLRRREVRVHFRRRHRELRVLLRTKTAAHHSHATRDERHRDVANWHAMKYGFDVYSKKINCSARYGMPQEMFYV